MPFSTFLPRFRLPMSCFFGRGREFRPVAPRQFHSNCLYLRNLLSFGPYCTVTRRTDQSAKGLVCDVECYPGDSWRGPPLCGRDSVCATPLSAFRFRALIHSYTDAYTRGAIPNLPSLRRSNHRVCGCRLSTTYLPYTHACPPLLFQLGPDWVRRPPTRPGRISKHRYRIRIDLARACREVD